MNGGVPDVFAPASPSSRRSTPPRFGYGGFPSTYPGPLCSPPLTNENHKTRKNYPFPGALLELPIPPAAFEQAHFPISAPLRALLEQSKTIPNDSSVPRKTLFSPDPS